MLLLNDLSHVSVLLIMFVANEENALRKRSYLEEPDDIHPLDMSEVKQQEGDMMASAALPVSFFFFSLC